MQEIIEWVCQTVSGRLPEENFHGKISLRKLKSATAMTSELFPTLLLLKNYYVFNPDLTLTYFRTFIAGTVNYLALRDRVFAIQI